MKIETKCLHEGYNPKNGEPQAMPIYQSTTYNYQSTEHIGQLFDLAVEGHMYSRISNPTVEMVEKKIASLEGGVGALCTTSGQAASLISILNICSSVDHFLAASTIYGGTINLFGVTLKRLGIECTFIDTNASPEEIAAQIRPNTRLIFGETLANPALTVFDIEKFAQVAHSHQIPLIVDNTFATPILCRPIEFGADIVIHSTTKYMDGHAVQLGGVIVDSGNFNWDNGKFPDFVEPDRLYANTSYWNRFGNAAFINKAKAQYLRDFGVTPSPFNAFLLNLGLETLHLRMPRHCGNALALAEYLEKHPQVNWVVYPGLKTHKSFERIKKYFNNSGASGVLTFGLKGGIDAIRPFIKALKIASLVVHVGDARTMVLHPASSTHAQLSPEERLAAGIPEDMIRVSVGIEDADDIIRDFEQALQAARQE